MARERSIPVHTGKPVGIWSILLICMVYPRTHGETADCDAALRHSCGLSPYTRGNQISRAFNANLEGSIPVHTGKPSPHQSLSLSPEVYPRTHGETPSLTNNIAYY